MSAGLRILEVHTCPLWQEDDGARTVGMRERADHPPVVGWVNVAVMEICGRRRELVLTLDAHGAN